MFRRKAVWAKRRRGDFNFLEGRIVGKSSGRIGVGSRISDGWMSGAWVLRTGLGYRLEMDSWTKRVWRVDMVDVRGEEGDRGFGWGNGEALRGGPVSDGGEVVVQDGYRLRD